MTKALTKYLLTLSILLLTGYGHLSARTYQGNRYFSPAKSLTKSEPTGAGTFLPDHASITKSPSSGSKKDYLIDNAELVEVEEEDDKDTSSKKYWASNSFATLFYALNGEYFFLYIKNRLSFYRQFSYFLSLPSLCIILQVFRI